MKDWLLDGAPSHLTMLLVLAFSAWEAWLGQTTLVKSNSTWALVVAGLKRILVASKVLPPDPPTLQQPDGSSR